MLDNILFSWNVVAPMLVYGTAGAIVGRIKLVPDSVYPEINKLYFNVFLPCLLFSSLYMKDYSDITGSTYIFIFSGIAVLASVSLFLLPLIVKDRSDCAVMAHALLRGNTTVYGIPLAISLLGGEIPASIAVILGFLTAVFNLLSPMVFARYGSRGKGFKSVIKGIITNPNIVVEILAIAMTLLNIRIPAFLSDSVRTLGSVSTPLAFVCLGATFTLKITREYAKKIVFFAMSRLIILPVIALSAAVLLFDFRGVELATVLAVFATPPAICTYPMAGIYGANSRLAGDLVVFSTVFSIGTLFLLILVIKTLGLV